MKSYIYQYLFQNINQSILIQETHIFLSYYYNERGEFISGENDFAVRIPLGTLRHCPKIIGLALGAAPNAITGALKTGLFTHLLVTESTARKILEK